MMDLIDIVAKNVDKSIVDMLEVEKKENIIQLVIDIEDKINKM